MSLPLKSSPNNLRQVGLSLAWNTWLEVLLYSCGVSDRSVILLIMEKISKARQSELHACFRELLNMQITFKLHVINELHDGALPCNVQ